GYQGRVRKIRVARERNGEKGRQMFGHLAFADHAETGDDHAFAFAALASKRHHAVAMHRVKPATLQQKIDEFHVPGAASAASVRGTVRGCLPSIRRRPWHSTR